MSCHVVGAYIVACYSMLAELVEDLAAYSHHCGFYHMYNICIYIYILLFYGYTMDNTYYGMHYGIHYEYNITIMEDLAAYSHHCGADVR